ncbi:MAG: DUF5683 domain-containing protein [Rikenellaceae bacterium]
MSREIVERINIAFKIGVMAIVLLVFLSSTLSHIVAQPRTIERTYVRGGLLGGGETPRELRDSLAGGDSLLLDSLVLRQDSTTTAVAAQSILTQTTLPIDSTELLNAPRVRYFTDSMSLSKVCWTATVLPGFGQIYNKQAWKLPIFYSAIAGGLALYLNENKTYKPLKEEYDLITYSSLERTEELNAVQNAMIRSNTRRQLYLGATIGSYIYMLGDAAVNYATNDTSDVKRATTLATICPGAGQIYNKSYWKIPFVIGGFASMIYVVDWNNRGYQRFSKAYKQVLAYDTDPDDYPDGSPDEFSGRYSSSYLQSLRDSYRRNRDLSIIMLAGLYVLQIVDAHVDAHFKDFDISDDLAFDIEPVMGYSYSPATNSNGATYGFKLGITF